MQPHALEKTTITNTISLFNENTNAKQEWEITADFDLRVEPNGKKTLLLKTTDTNQQTRYLAGKDVGFNPLRTRENLIVAFEGLAEDQIGAVLDIDAEDNLLSEIKEMETSPRKKWGTVTTQRIDNKAKEVEASFKAVEARLKQEVPGFFTMFPSYPS